MKYFLLMFLFVPLIGATQTVERQPIDIIYGNQIIRTEHQVVLSSKEKVAVIPIERSTPKLGPNVVITAEGKVSSYLEDDDIAKREQAIYDEVNRRTEEDPFTVLFAGEIPAEIQEKRLRMMPEIGVVGGGQINVPTDVPADTSKVKLNESSTKEEASNVKDGMPPVPVSDEEALEKLIGG